MATPIYDLISKTTLGGVAVGGGVQKEHYSEVVIPSKTNATTDSLKFVDTQHTCYVIPIGETPTRKRDAPSKQNSWLAPIIPLCYSTPDCDPAKAKFPRAGGFMYIYIGDYLYRELAVLREGKYRDVNLHQYQGKDNRPATVEIDTRILVPHMVDGTVNTISICYSEIQWSWARINSMGGMDPDDFRLDVDTPPPLANDAGISKGTAEQNRDARMQQLDLSGCKSGYSTLEPNGKFARVENANNPTATLWGLLLHKKSGMPLVYLHDPLGIAKTNLGTLLAVKTELNKFIARVTDHEHYKSAMMAYRTFFDQKLYERYNPKCKAHVHRFKDKSDSAKLLRECRSQIDENYIKGILQVPARKSLRKIIRDLKTIHVEFMDGKFEGEDLSASNSDFISVNEALKDYTELEAPAYGLLWQTYMDLINIMPFDPSILDKALDLIQDHDQVPRDKDPGHLYLKRLLEPTHPLHAMLFPDNTQVDEYSNKYEVDPDEIEKLDGSGKFRTIGYAKTFVQSQRLFFQQEKLPTSLKRFQNTIGDFIMLAAGQVFDPELPQPASITMNPLFRLSIALNDPELQSLHLVKKGTDISTVLILDGRLTIFEKIRQSQNPADIGTVTNNPGSETGKVNVHDAVTGKAFGSTELAQIANNKGVPDDLSDLAWSSLFTTSPDNVPYTGYTVGEFAAVDKGSKLASKILSAVPKTAKYSTAMNTLVTINDVKLPTLLVVFKVVNVFVAYSKFSKAKSKEEIIKNGTKTALAALALPFAIIELTTKFMSDDDAVKFWAKGFSKVSVGKFGASLVVSKKLAKSLILEKTTTTLMGKLSINALTKISTGFTGAGVLMSGWDMMDALLKDDDDVALAYGVQMAAGIGLAISAIGGTSVATTGFLVGLGPWGWAFLAVFLISGILAALFIDSSLEKWAKHGPFAKISDRMTQEYSNKPSRYAYQSLLALLMPPQIKISDKKELGLIYVEVHASGFESGKSTLTIDALASQGEFQGRTQMPMFSKEQQTLELFGWAPIVDPDLPSITHGLRYMYKRPKVYAVNKIFARVQHITKEGFIIPFDPVNTNVESADPLFIDDKINGWAYAKPLIVKKT